MTNENSAYFDLKEKYVNLLEKKLELNEKYDNLLESKNKKVKFEELKKQNDYLEDRLNIIHHTLYKEEETIDERFITINSILNDYYSNK